MATQLINLGTTGLLIGNCTFSWCRRMSDGSSVDTSAASLVERGNGYYLLTVPTVTEDTDFYIYQTSTPSNYAYGVLSVAGPTIATIPAIAPSRLTTQTVNGFISKILTDIGEPLDSTGFPTRTDVLNAYNYIQRQITKETQNLIVTLAQQTVNSGDTTIRINSNGDMVKIHEAWKVTQTGKKVPLNVFTAQQMDGFNPSWLTKTDSELRGLVTEFSAEGEARPYPILTANEDVIISILKIATILSSEYVETGDTANQVSMWILDGVTVNNTAAFQLWWELTNAAGVRTVKLYKTSAKLSGDLVAQGSLTGDGTMTLTEQNNSGISGTVVVTYTADDTDTGNILTFYTVEIPAADIMALEAGVKWLLYTLERGGKNEEKAKFYLTLYGYKDNGLHGGLLSEIRRRVQSKREGTFRTLQPRMDTRAGLRR